MVLCWFCKSVIGDRSPAPPLVYHMFDSDILHHGGLVKWYNESFTHSCWGFDSLIHYAHKTDSNSVYYGSDRH